MKLLLAVSRNWFLLNFRPEENGEPYVHAREKYNYM